MSKKGTLSKEEVKEEVTRLLTHFGIIMAEELGSLKRLSRVEMREKLIDVSEGAITEILQREKRVREQEKVVQLLARIKSKVRKEMSGKDYVTRKDVREAFADVCSAATRGCTRL